jgi:mannitol-1-/sugar-/sorbitol-6-phosphatase
MDQTNNAMQSLHVRGVLFDMDGVLIDSTSADERSWRRWARFHGMEGIFSPQATHGRRTIDTLRLLRPDLDPLIELDRMEAFDAEESDGMVLLAGVDRLLAALPPNTWTVVTSASDQVMRTRLETAGLTLPPNVVTAESVTNGKPHPEPYLTAAKLLNLDPTECLVVEDSPTGIEAGKAAGCKVLAVAFSHSATQLAGADWIVSSLGQVAVRPENDGRIMIRGWGRGLAPAD